MTCHSLPVGAQQLPTPETSRQVPAAALYSCALREVQTARLAHLGKMSKCVKLIIWLPFNIAHDCHNVFSFFIFIHLVFQRSVRVDMEFVIREQQA